MKKNLAMGLCALLVCSSAATARIPDKDQQTPETVRRIELPSFLGVELTDVTKETVSRLKLHEERGALVEGVTTGSSAAKAGLQRNDVVIKWDGQPVESARELTRRIRETPAGRAVKLGVIRDGREIEVNVTLEERSRPVIRYALTPRPAVRIATTPRPALSVLRPNPIIRYDGALSRRSLGVELQSMTQQLAEYFGLSKRSGALVVFVFADSPAAKAGLKAGDVILSAGNETIDNPMDLRRVLSGKGEGSMEFKIMRERREQTLTIALEKGTSSWLLGPGSGTADELEVVRASIAPVIVNVPNIAIPAATMKYSLKPIKIHVPKMKFAPVVVPDIDFEQMNIEIPEIHLDQMNIAVPKLDLKPMKIEIPDIHLEPMNLEVPQLLLEPMKIEVPKIKINPATVLVAPRRIVL